MMTKRMKKADFENEDEQEKIMKKRIEQKMETWEVQSLDVWGNAREGWEVRFSKRGHSETFAASDLRGAINQAMDRFLSRFSG